MCDHREDYPIRGSNLTRRYESNFEFYSLSTSFQHMVTAQDAKGTSDTLLRKCYCTHLHKLVSSEEWG